MNVWILQTGEPLHCDEESARPMRAINLSNKLTDAGHNVVLWSSSFYHQKKRHRSRRYAVHKISRRLEIRLIHSLGYKKHIGIVRVIDHAHLAWNLRAALKKEKTIPDVAFVGYPPIEASAIMSNWLKNKGVPTILDVKDLWPSIFVDVFPRVLRPFARFLLYPYFVLAKKTMKEVDGISTMSQGFLDWCLNFSNRYPSENDRVFRLTTLSMDLEFKKSCAERLYWDKMGVTSDDANIIFVGTFSTAFDFEQVYIAAKLVKDCHFILCGHGPCLSRTKDMMRDLPNVIFPGWIDASQLKSLSGISIATLAPYKNVENFTLNIPNKIVDSLMFGLPILSPLKGEVKSLISDNKVGFTYDDKNTLASCIQTLVADSKLHGEMSINAKNLYKDKFEFNKVYDGLVNHLESMAAGK